MAAGWLLMQQILERRKRDMEAADNAARDSQAQTQRPGCTVCGAERVPLSQFCREHQP